MTGILDIESMADHMADAEKSLRAAVAMIAEFEHRFDTADADRLVYAAERIEFLASSIASLTRSRSEAMFKLL